MAQRPSIDDEAGFHSAAATLEVPPDATCWICLENDNDEAYSEEGPPDVRSRNKKGHLARGCACRGDSAGYVHIPCLVQYIRRKIDENHELGNEWGPLLMNCPNCREPYLGSFAVDLARAYAESTSDLTECDPRREYGQLNLATKIRSTDPRAAKLIYMKLIKSLRSRLSENASEEEITDRRSCEIVCLIGLSSLCELTEDYKGANLYVNEANEVATGNDFDPHHDVMLDIQWMQQRKSGAAVGDSLGLNSQQLQEISRRHQEYAGPNHELTILIELALAEALVGEGKVDEGMSLFKDLVDRSVSFLGPEHQTTIKVELRYTEINARTKKLPYATIWKKDDRNWYGKKAVISPPTCSNASDEKYICVSIDESRSKMATQVSLSDVVFCDGTPIICQGITKAKDRHINGKRGIIKSYHGNKGTYVVHVDNDSHRRHTVKRENVRVVFDDT